MLQRQQEGSLGCAALRAASIGMTGYFAICVCPVLTGERNNDNREDPAVHRAREAVAAKESRAGCRVSRDRRQRDSRPGTIPCSPTEEPLVQSAEASDRLADARSSRCVRAKPLIPKAADATDATDARFGPDSARLRGRDVRNLERLSCDRKKAPATASRAFLRSLQAVDFKRFRPHDRTDRKIRHPDSFFAASITATVSGETLRHAGAHNDGAESADVARRKLMAGSALLRGAQALRTVGSPDGGPL